MKLSSLDWRALDGRIDWRIGLAASAGLAIAGGVVLFRWLSRPPDPDQIERQRRSHLNRVGRIVEGRVVELLEVSAPLGSSRRSAHRHVAAAAGIAAAVAPAAAKRQLVCYSYSISGVSYETSQDVTGLEAGVVLARLTAGQSASVKYDPANPSNSILAADNWSGLN